MDKETQKRVIESLDGTFERMMRTVLPNASPKDMALAIRVFKSNAEVKKIKKQIQKAPEPNPDALNQALADLEQYITLIRDGVGYAAKKISPRKRGPRPTIPKEKWPEVCAKLEGLHKIMSIRAAAANIANEFGVAERTVFRIWEDRDQIMKAQQAALKEKKS